MDERLKKALELSNFVVTLDNQKRLLKEKYHGSLLYFYKGSQFTVTKELMSFVAMLVSRENIEDVVLTDDNDIPASISNLEEFQDDIFEVYSTASNQYHAQYEELKKKRGTGKLVDYDKE
jgi:hypothetical protein